MSADARAPTIDLSLESAFSLHNLEVRPATLEVLSSDGRREVLEHRVMQVLVALALRPGEVVTRDLLNELCWGGRVVGEDALNRCIGRLRKLAVTYGGFAIETLPRVGFRLSKMDNACRGSFPSKPSIAVLPFINLSNDKEQDYFADGMMEEIVAALTRFKSLFVISSGSTFAFKSQSVGPQEAGRDLGVRYVLEGSVRQAAGRVRIAVKLMDTAEGAQIWANRFEDTLDDMFVLQDRVALAIAAAIEPSITQVEIERASRRPTQDQNSYDLYLRGLAAARAHSKAGWHQALAYFERAVALDPNFGEAWSQIAYSHAVITHFGWSEASDAASHAEQAREARRRALETASDDATVLAEAGAQIGDIDTAVDLVERALTLNPGSANIWMLSGIVRSRAGEIALSGEHHEMAMRLDPIGVAGWTAAGYLAGVRFLQGRYVEAIALCKRHLQYREGPIALGTMAACYARLGDIEAAKGAIARRRAVTSQSFDNFIKATVRNPDQRRDWLDALALIEQETSCR